ncbi:MAG TPA: ATP-binding protein [Chryseolinea sp.]|nr:ATP-binding protein [Chryseolinea sp.]
MDNSTVKDMTAVQDTIAKEKNSDTKVLTNDDVLRLVLERVRTAASIRVQWLRKIWSEAGAATSGNLQQTEIDGYLSDIDDAEGELNWRTNDESVRPLIGRLFEIQDILSKDKHSKLFWLTKVFRLDDVEVDILQTCLAFAMETNLGRVFAFLQDHRGRNYVSMEMIARLFGPLHASTILPMPMLTRWRLIEVIDMGRNEPALLQCDAFVRDWLSGVSGLDHHLKAVACIQQRFAPLEHWPLNETVNSIGRILNVDPEASVRLLISGDEGSGRKTFSAAVSRTLGLGALTVHADKVSDQQWPATYLYAQRQAYLDQYAVIWTGIQGKAWPSQEPAFPIQFIVGASNESFPPADTIDHTVDLPALPAKVAVDLWKGYVPAAVNWQEDELREIVLRRTPTVGQIVDAARRGVRTPNEALMFLKSGAKQQLGTLANPLLGDFSWNDLVLSEALKKSLEDFCFEAKDRALLWENPGARRLFPQGRGLIALFTGAPGTGKTMASQVIANALQRDLFRIDLSTVVSKYVGETSKNIERILSRARSMDVVLLFDEADALFGKRTEIKDAHDRFANTDTNYLLQAIEEYSGIVILASNRKTNIDGGFMRRLRYVLDFPRPDAQQRYVLWSRILKELIGSDLALSLDTDVRSLADMLEITGAQIKMSVLSALFMSRRDGKTIKISHLLRGLERELAKEGRGLGRQIIELFKGVYHD